jgi:hypothetical protein
MNKEENGRETNNKAQKENALIMKEKDNFLKENRKLVQVDDDHPE